METILNAKVKTGKNAFIARLDKENDSLIIETTKKPENNEANKEILRKLRKILKAEIEIVSGLKSKEKKIKINLQKEQVLNLLNAQTNSK